MACCKKYLNLIAHHPRIKIKVYKTSKAGIKLHKTDFISSLIHFELHTLGHFTGKKRIGKEGMQRDVEFPLFSFCQYREGKECRICISEPEQYNIRKRQTLLVLEMISNIPYLTVHEVL